MESKILVHGQTNRIINFAMNQNYVPLVRSLIVTNLTQEELKGLKLSITSEPDFTKFYEVNIDTIMPGAAVEITPVHLMVKPDFIIALNERMLANLHVVIEQNGENLYERDYSTILLAYDEWGGLNSMPEMIAAFVTPNVQAVSQVIADAGTYLMEWDKNPSFTGYQRQNPNVVLKQMAAVYSALKKQNITYVVPPASYEETGQKVRLPETLYEQRMGTCLDLALYYAACLEAVAINPLLIFEKEHCYVGAFLEETTFSDCTTDDVTAITKRTATGIEQIALVECTDLVVGKNVDFDEARNHALLRLQKTENFVLAVDIKRTRGGGIRPIPSRKIENGKFIAAVYEERSSEELMHAPDTVNNVILPDFNKQEKLTKQKLWERKLLDLSLRNTLLSFRNTRSVVQLMISDLGELEDSLSRGTSFQILPKPTDWENTARDGRIYEIETNRELIADIAKSEAKSNRIRTFLSEEELEKNLKYLHRQAKNSLEENGSNTLYVALGFLRWYETDLSEKARYAPLVLVPVDITKKVQNKSYSIKIRDEEAQVNITLIEMLRQDFGINISGLDPLPYDENGVNLVNIFSIFRHAVMERKRWDVEELSFIGLFSFARFIMWNDIRNRSEDLKQNKVVASLMSGKMEWETTDSALYENVGNDALEYELDEIMDPSQTAVLASADSSQLGAICAAAKGESFVLHGPPGTGKSQTITNMIANALYQGKSVLFVAEKMAALSVVEKRLTKLGLDPFCLELHSNKVQKRAVLKQLEQTLEIGRKNAPEDYEAVADNLLAKRRELNRYVRSLHQKRAYGMSLYEAIIRFEKNAAFKGVVAFSEETLNKVTKETFAEWLNRLDSYIVAAAQCSKDAVLAMKPVKTEQYSIGSKERITEKLAAYKYGLYDVKEVYINVASKLGIRERFDYNTLIGIYSLYNIMSTTQCILPGVIQNKYLESQDASIRSLIELGQRQVEMYIKVVNEFEQSIFTYNVNEAYASYKQAQGARNVTKSMAENRLVRELKVHVKNSNAVNKNNLTYYFDLLNNYYSAYSEIMRTDTNLTAQFGNLYAGVNTNWEVLKNAYEASVELRTVIRGIAASEYEYEILLSNCMALTADDMSRKYVEKVSELRKLKAELINEDKIFLGCEQSRDYITDVIKVIDGVLNHIDMLREWIGLRQSMDVLNAAGLNGLVKAYEDGVVEAEHMKPALEANLCYGLIMLTIKQEPHLGVFQGAQFDNVVEQFRKLNEEYERLCKEELIAKLSSRIPLSGNVAGSSEVGILKKAIKSGGRMMSIRKLFDSIPELLVRMCPCMMMSPISVAQFIDPSFKKFDLVIFDEASQLPTSEAVGAIARGENVIVVGDPKQLPPTSFFVANQFDEENYEMEDMESVLDDCLALNLPQRHLAWHYRSRHESLIAFSNNQYYENKLYTFPSPCDMVSHVTYVPVEGVYDKRATRQNRKEAECVVAEIVRRLRSPELRKDSIGVVTFSVAQQNLVDDLLNEAFRQDPELIAIAEKMSEPIIIKNLENVQGDERDVILFSVGYGPDKDGKVSMNFGPLNNEGGWRRLNVAITRSRKEMMVFAVLRPEHIDLSRTTAEGVIGLKGFLEFAMRGKNTLIAKNGQTKVRDNEFEKMIAADIEKAGCHTKCDIGASEYKIDIAVIHPERPDEYILGVMCDGTTYKEAQTARDRNILQPDVLTGLGWNIMRVYIMDYLDNKERVVNNIVLKVKELLNKEKEMIIAEETVTEDMTPESSTPSEALSAEPALANTTSTETSTINNACYFEPYVVKKIGTADTFVSENAKGKIRDTITSIIETEAPVSRKRLEKCLMESFDISRKTAKIEQIIEEEIRNVNPNESMSNGTCFYWKKEQMPQVYETYRIPVDEAGRRTMDDICVEEIATAIRDVMIQQIGIMKTDLVRETGKVFGFTRLGDVIELSVIRGLLEARRRGYVDISEDGEKVTVR